MNQKAARLKQVIITAGAVLLLVASVIIASTSLYLYFFGPEKILFTSTRDGNYEIYDMNSDGSVPCRLTNQPGPDYNASWAPEGGQIAFASQPGGYLEIYVMNSDGTDLSRLTDINSNDNPDWSPNGKKIAFTSLRDGDAEIYVMSADGSGQTRLTNSRGYDVRPAWSPDGNMIAFESTRIEGEPWRSEDAISKIYLMNSDGLNQSLWSANNDRFPAWSPDGREIAFVSLRHGYGEIFIKTVDQTREYQITSYPEFPAGDGKISWSPDGKKLVFGSYVDNAHGSIYVVDIDSLVLTELTYGNNSDSGPEWMRVSTIPAWINWFRLTNPSSHLTCGGI